MILFKDNNVYIENDGTFDVEKIFTCGQCFRFEGKNQDFSGVAMGRSLHVFSKDNYVVLENVSEDEFQSRWKSYFDLDRDYNEINECLSVEKTIKEAMEISRGIRILRQDKWEALCSFIISQNNNIPRIKKIIASLCENFGDKNGDCYTFPTAAKLAAAGIDGLAVIRSGFRAKYIIDAANKVSQGGIDLDRIDSMAYEEAKAYLMQIKGVGNKVADCVLLFAYGFFTAFPKDVWIKRVIEKYYGDDFDESIFSPYGGIAQQYLFYMERLKENIK